MQQEIAFHVISTLGSKIYFPKKTIARWYISAANITNKTITW